MLVLYFYLQRYFNPRAPRGARLIDGCHHARHIHNFNPRAPRGARRSCARSRSRWWGYFNPRAPRGARPLGISYQEIPPEKWKKEFGLNTDKQKSIAVCRQLFPEADLRHSERSRVDNDGMAEALLMAEYARRKL